MDESIFLSARASAQMAFTLHPGWLAATSHGVIVPARKVLGQAFPFSGHPHFNPTPRGSARHGIGGPAGCLPKDTASTSGFAVIRPPRRGGTATARAKYVPNLSKNSPPGPGRIMGAYGFEEKHKKKHISFAAKNRYFALGKTLPSPEKQKFHGCISTKNDKISENRHRKAARTFEDFMGFPSLVALGAICYILFGTPIFGQYSLLQLFSYHPQIHYQAANCDPADNPASRIMEGNDL